MAYTLEYQRTVTIPADLYDPANDNIGVGFGSSIASDSTKLAIGCQWKYHHADWNGAVYIYNWDGTFVQELQPDLADYGNNGFGKCIGLSGEWLLVGCPWNEVVYFYQWNGSSFDFKQRLSGSTVVPGNNFGYSVAISGSVAVVGTPRLADGSAGGTVFVFRESGGTWTEDQIITAPVNNFDRFGEFVAVYGTVLAVTDPYYDDDFTNEGHASIYEESGGTFSLAKEINHTECGGTTVDRYFGTSIAVVSETKVIVGWAGRDGPTGLGNVGALSVWEKIAGTWSQRQVLTAEPEGVSINAELGGWGAGNGDGSLATDGIFVIGGARGWEPEASAGWMGAGFLWAYNAFSDNYGQDDYDYPEIEGEFCAASVNASALQFALGGSTAEAGFEENDLVGVVRIYAVVPPPEITTTGSFPCSVNIAKIDPIVIPVPRNIWNEFDEHAATTSLFRLPGEKNWEL